MLAIGPASLVCVQSTKHGSGFISSTFLELMGTLHKDVQVLMKQVCPVTMLSAAQGWLKGLS